MIADPFLQQVPSEPTLEEKRSELLELRLSIGSSFIHALDLAIDVHDVTPREADVLRLICDGCSNKEIAARLGNTEKTIKHHVRHVARKFGISTRAELMAIFVGRRS